MRMELTISDLYSVQREMFNLRLPPRSYTIRLFSKAKVCDEKLHSIKTLTCDQK
jgi:hypothetical protein